MIKKYVHYPFWPQEAWELQIEKTGPREWHPSLRLTPAFLLPSHVSSAFHCTPPSVFPPHGQNFCCHRIWLWLILTKKKKGVCGKDIKKKTHRFSSKFKEQNKKKPIRLWRQLGWKSTNYSDLHHSHQKPGMTSSCYCNTSSCWDRQEDCWGSLSTSLAPGSERSCLGGRIHIIFLWLLNVHAGMYIDMNAHIPLSQHTH